MTTPNVETKPGGRGPSAHWSYRPDIDLAEGPQEFIVTADMPGVRSDGVRVEFEDGVLAIHGVVAARERTDAEPLVEEYGTGDFDRRVRVSGQIDAAKIAAECANGVLTVRLPKTERAKSRRIPVRST